MFHNFCRFFYIWHTLVKFGIDKLIHDTSLNFIIKLFTYIMPISWFRDISELDEVRAREALEVLGPIYVKFGQAISTRPDLLNPTMAIELAKLQDNVAPFPIDNAKKIIEKSLKQPIDKAFLEFSNEVLVSASIAQVHSAKLNTGEEVIIKVVRPGIEKTIYRDIKLMMFFAKVINLLSNNAKRLRLPEVVDEFDKTIAYELDLIQEAANGCVLRENFKDSDLLYVPKIYLDYCRKNILVMDCINAISIDDIDTLKKNNVNLKKLAANGVTIFFTQVFFHQYFHADMHPGNIFVDISDPENPKYIGIDFGIMGSLNDRDQYYLAENFLAFFNRDYRRVAQLHIDSGWVPTYVNVIEFETAIRRASEPIFGKPLKEISFAQFLLTLFQTAKKFEMKVQPQLVLLQKTFFNIEGLGRILYPDLDIWETGKPILEKWMKNQFSAKHVYHRLKSRSGEYNQIIEELPSLIRKNLKVNSVEKKRENNQVINAILIGFFSLILFQEDLWGDPITRYFIIIILITLSWKFLKSK